MALFFVFLLWQKVRQNCRECILTELNVSRSENSSKTLVRNNFRKWSHALVTSRSKIDWKGKEKERIFKTSPKSVSLQIDFEIVGFRNIQSSTRYINLKMTWLLNFSKCSHPKIWSEIHLEIIIASIFVARLTLPFSWSRKEKSIIGLNLLHFPSKITKE